jgi:4a-hydroxytetrahydrobiopterin dehydratase
MSAAAEDRAQPPMKRIDARTLAEWLARAPAWRHDPERGAITRTFAFADFAEAFAFMTQLALRAEACDHHPEWSNVYDKVEVSFTTHDAGGLTALDLQMADAADAAHARRAARD